MNNSKVTRTSKRPLIFGGITTVALLLIGTTFVLPTSTDNGLSKFKGVELQVAEAALQANNTNGTDHIRDLPFIYKGSYVKEVYAGLPREGQCNSGNTYSDNPASMKHYGVVIGWRTFLSIEYRTTSIHGCQIYGG